MFVFGFPCGARDNPWPSIIAVERESLSVLFFFFLIGCKDSTGMRSERRKRGDVFLEEREKGGRNNRREEDQGKGREDKRREGKNGRE